MKLKTLLALFSFAFAMAGDSSPSDASAYIISPKDGDVLSGKVTVLFGLKGMGIAPAGTEKANTGHHHLLIDLDSLPNMSQPLPATDKIKHFGGGQTETSLDLSKGKHTLQILLGNHMHIPHAKPVLSEKITITIQ